MREVRDFVEKDVVNDSEEVVMIEESEDVKTVIK